MSPITFISVLEYRHNQQFSENKLQKYYNYFSKVIFVNRIRFLVSEQFNKFIKVIKALWKLNKRYSKLNVPLRTLLKTKPVLFTFII